LLWRSHSYCESQKQATELLRNPAQGLSTTRPQFRASLIVERFFIFFGLPSPGYPAADPRNGFQRWRGRSLAPTSTCARSAAWGAGRRHWIYVGSAPSSWHPNRQPVQPWVSAMCGTA